jgi:hypothetical protein
MNVVTFETAAKLKAAGFPQDPSDGCHFYTGRGTLTYIVYIDDDGDVFSLLGGEVKGVANIDAGYFAPTPEDIMQEINDEFLQLIWAHGAWWAWNEDSPLSIVDRVKSGDNAAELMAREYFKRKGI